MGLETDLPATGDYAALELYTRLAAQGAPAPGALLAVRLPPPRPRVFLCERAAVRAHRRAFRRDPLTAALVNVVSIALMLRRLGRDGGRAGALAGALVLALFPVVARPAWLFSAWNPNVAGPSASASRWWGSRAVAAGNVRALPLAVLAASFAAQTHLGVLPAAAAIALAAGLLHVPPVRRAAGLPPLGTSAHRSILLAVALAAIVWAPPILEQLSPEGGNLSHILGFSSLPDERHPRARHWWLPAPPSWAG